MAARLTVSSQAKRYRRWLRAGSGVRSAGAHTDTLCSSSPDDGADLVEWQVQHRQSGQAFPAAWEGPIELVGPRSDGFQVCQVAPLVRNCTCATSWSAAWYEGCKLHGCRPIQASKHSSRLCGAGQVPVCMLYSCPIRLLTCQLAELEVQLPQAGQLRCPGGWHAA